MSHRKTLARLAAAPLLMIALTAPPALADTPYTDAERAANDRFNREATVVQQDRRSENTVDPSRADVPRSWPAYPRALPPAEIPASAPATVADDGDDWVVPVLAIGGTLLLGAGLAAGSIRSRRVRPA